MSIYKRFRAGCLGIAFSALGTAPAIARPVTAETEPAAIIQIAQVDEAAEDSTSAPPPGEGATDEIGAPSSPAPGSIISVTTGDIVLLDEGQGAKSPLRLAPQAGNRTQLDTDISINVTTEIDGQTAPNPGFPSIGMLLGIEVVEVDEAGQITYNITYDDISMGDDTSFPPEARQMIDDVFQQLKDLKLVLVGDDRGRVLAANVEAPEGLNPFLVQMLDSLSQSMKQVSAPLPEEAIGIGARWSITGSVTAGGLTFEQTAIYELVEREGDRFTVTVEVEQVAEPQSVGPAGIAVELTDYSASGNGNLVMDIGYPVPISGLFDLISTTQLSPSHLDQVIVSRAEVRMELNQK
ncbi:MAG: hypothetical protein ACFCBU_14920 [Cyanophyceae cyanobacterium]